MDQQTAPVNVPAQLSDLAEYVRQEIAGSQEKNQARRKLGDFLINVFSDEDHRENVLRDESARQEVITLLTKYDTAEQAETDRFVSKFQIIEQMLIMLATLIEKGKQGVDF